SGLKVTGAVDEQTSVAIDAGLKKDLAQPHPPASEGTPSIAPAASASRDAISEEPAPNDEEFVVRGHVVYKDGLLIEGMTVRAFNKDLGHEDVLGEAVTEREGRYEIKYSAAKFSRP